MSSYSNGRVAIYRQYKRMLKSLKILVDSGIIGPEEFEAKKGAIDAIYEKLKEERLRNRPASMLPPGRPKRSVVSPPRTDCKACSGPIPEEFRAKGHIYCKAACAPLAFYGLPARQAG